MDKEIIAWLRFGCVIIVFELIFQSMEEQVKLENCKPDSWGFSSSTIKYSVTTNVCNNIIFPNNS